MKDCAGVAGGSAHLDECQECVGGTTGKDPCECEGDKCPICGGIVVIDDESDVGLRSATATGEALSCIKCSCLKKYKRTDECKAYLQMYNDTVTQRWEYLALITQNGVYTWKAEDDNGGNGFGPFSPKWDSQNKRWYITRADGGKDYILAGAHVHWQTDIPYFSSEDLTFAVKLNGAPYLLIRANGTIDAQWSPDGVGTQYFSAIKDYSIAKISNCSSGYSLMNLLNGY